MSREPMNGEHVDELISASLNGELSSAERARLHDHLGSCPACRDTLAAFREQRSLLGGLRHEAAPRDLYPRVRQALEAAPAVPWWRRSGGILALGATAMTVFAAAVLVGLATQTGLFERPGVASDPDASPGITIVEPSATPTAAPLPPGPTDTAPEPTAAPGATASPATPAPTSAPTREPTPAASPSPAPTAEPSPEPSPAPTEPVVAGPLDPGSDGAAYLALSGPLDELALSLTALGTEGDDVIAELRTPSGPPVTSELSPDGRWLAYQTRRGESGANDVWVVELSTGAGRRIGDTLADTPFTQRMTWSADGRLLAFTVAEWEVPDGEEAGQDVWLFDVEAGRSEPLTELGNAYAASFEGEDLWISTAGDVPVSYLLPLDDDPAELGELSDEERLEDAAVRRLSRVFMPILAPDGRRAIFWRGVMGSEAGSWRFVSGGQPYLSATSSSGQPRFTGGEPLFSDLEVGRDAFAFASVAWSADSDTFSVWGAEWQGTPQDPTGSYPEPGAVYLARASGETLIGPESALDLGDLDGFLVDATPAPDGASVAVTIGQPLGGVLDAPAARLFILAFSLSDGAVASEAPVEPVVGEVSWVGPIVHPPAAADEEASAEPPPQP